MSIKRSPFLLQDLLGETDQNKPLGRQKGEACSLAIWLHHSVPPPKHCGVPRAAMATAQCQHCTVHTPAGSLLPALHRVLATTKQNRTPIPSTPNRHDCFPTASRVGVAGASSGQGSDPQVPGHSGAGGAGGSSAGGQWSRGIRCVRGNPRRDGQRTMGGPRARAPPLLGQDPRRGGSQHPPRPPPGAQAAPHHLPLLPRRPRPPGPPVGAGAGWGAGTGRT